MQYPLYVTLWGVEGATMNVHWGCEQQRLNLKLGEMWKKKAEDLDRRWNFYVRQGRLERMSEEEK